MEKTKPIQRLIEIFDKINKVDDFEAKYIETDFVLVVSLTDSNASFYEQFIINDENETLIIDEIQNTTKIPTSQLVEQLEEAWDEYL